MTYKCMSSTIVLGMMIGCMGTALAATPIDVSKQKFSSLKNNFAVTQPGFASSKEENQLSTLRFYQTKTGVNHARMQQTFKGVNVWGGYAIAHIKGNKSDVKGFVSGSVGSDQQVSMNGIVYQDLANDLTQSPEFYQSKAKMDAALNAVMKDYASNQVSQKNVKLIVFVDEQNKAHWAYHVSFLVSQEGMIPERPTFLMNAESHDVYQKWNDIKTEKTDVKAAGFGGNELVGEINYNGFDYPHLNISRDGDTETCYMENSEVKLVDYKKSSYKTMNFSCNDDSMVDGAYLTGYDNDGYDKINGAYSPSDDAFYQGSIIKAMYQEWYNTDVLGKKLVMRVHYGSRYENAFWDGTQMTFGDGASTFYPLVSLGVSAHEISHGFTEFNSDLQYYGQSGGLNESFSDIAAQAAEHYSYLQTGADKNDWTIGSRIVKTGALPPYDSEECRDKPEALRYMDLPHCDNDKWRRSIDTADDYYSGLDVHYSSGVFNRMFYLLSTSGNWDTQKAFDVMVKANQHYWVPTSTFQQAADGVCEAAKELNYDTTVVASAVEGVGLDADACQ